MWLKRLEVHNFKSLRGIQFTPSELSLLLGPNGSGKTNFATAFDFLADVYRSGVEYAVARKGGYENIAFRQERRSKAGISFLIELYFPASENDGLFYRYQKSKPSGLTFRHQFSLQADTTEIRSNFRITEEELSIFSVNEDRNPVLPGLEYTKDLQGVSYKRERQSIRFIKRGKGNLVDYLSERYRYSSSDAESTDLEIGDQDLLVAWPVLLNRVFTHFTRNASRMAVFQLSPYLSRQPGVPTPNPNLNRTGENLPAVVDWLQRKHSSSWELVLAAMKEVLPRLSNIRVDYLHTKTLGLWFEESGVTRAWSSEDMSDGTIQVLAMLVGLADPRNSLLLIEEPENSIHPWILKSLFGRFRQISKNKNVILTTHSPVVIDQMKPNEAWVVYRQGGETRLSSLAKLNPSIQPNWEQGEFRLSDFIDSGLEIKAVPSHSEDDFDL